MMLHNRNGFSLLEGILSLGILAIIIPIIMSSFYLQETISKNNRDTWKQIDIMNDFCTFVQLNDFNYIKQLSEQDSALYVVNNNQNDIIFREFVSQDIWEHSQSTDKEYYIIQVQQISNLFADDKNTIKPYIPLICKLSKINQNDISNNKNDQNTLFVALKNY